MSTGRTSTASVTAGLLPLAVPTAAVGVLAVLVAAALQGSTGALGAAAGAALVLTSFASTHLVLDRTRQLPAELTLVVALGLYVLKVVLLAVVFVLLEAAGLLGDPLHRAALALTVICCTLVWTAAEIRAAVTTRQPLLDLAGATGSTPRSTR